MNCQNQRRSVLVLLAAIVLSACTPSVPNDVIKPGNMEDILYDYYVSQGMAQLPSGAESSEYKRELYMNAVLKKHGVTRAEFDSSLVYYYTRADHFTKIAKRVQERLAEDALEVGTSEGEVERLSSLSATGDTANIWSFDPCYMLVPYAPNNRMQFSLKADTAYRQGDSFLLAFQSDFLYQSGSKDAVAYLAVKYENDSVAHSVTHFSVNGNTTLRLSSCNEKVKELSGFLYLGSGYDKDAVGVRMLFVSNIRLIRFHKKEETEPQKPAAPTAEQKADSLSRVPDSLRPQRRRLGERPMPAPDHQSIKPITR